MTTVAVDGPTTVLGRRVAALARAEDGVAVVHAPTRLGHVDGDHLVVLAPGPGPEVDGSTVGGVGLDAAVRLLERTTATQVVVLSTAMVYGARPDNPVPLTEDAEVRPNRGCRFALARAELERAAEDLRRRRPGVRVAVLRPSVCTAGTEERDWLERSAWHARSVRHQGTERLGQFLHVEDLARAIEFARRSGLDGVFNVAPDGWLSERDQLELVGAGRPPRLDPIVSRWLSRTRWSVGAASTPPDVFPYTRWSWVVSNERLRAAGWEPVHTNEESFVMGHRAGWWSSLTADQRQAVSLGGGALGVVAVGVAAWAVVRRVLRER